MKCHYLECQTEFINPLSIADIRICSNDYPKEMCIADEALHWPFLHDLIPKTKTSNMIQYPCRINLNNLISHKHLHGHGVHSFAWYFKEELKRFHVTQLILHNCFRILEK
ncbi:hypothetical protein OIU85_005942 [Salix viminalis]|uniref:Uncharacterized protein n=1 Tax=Salix viminalis TaxID=40686 RepID=A0A9Q0STY5_SALVM|nr:hypothetical protein OIU85_005942 [Salix viminalis]